MQLYAEMGVLGRKGYTTYITEYINIQYAI